MSLLNKTKSYNYTERIGVKNVGTWNESELSYPGRSHGHVEINFKTWSKTVYHEKSAEVILPDIVNDIWEGLNIRR
ncbi:MAG TPA: hypothetical protein VFC41_05225 [Anaerovoracaceae bacterium]|nr:hypothetical protein [Anaerovoracaceae bacterium]